MNTLFKKVPAALLLIGGVSIMQIHAIEFWNRYAGDYGVLWSVMLEGAALWLWSQHSMPKSLLAFIASALVLAGPLYEVSAPAIAQYQVAQSAPGLAAKREQQLLTDQQRLTESLATYNANSETRAGWLTAISGTQAELSAVNDRLNALYAEQSEASPMAWQAVVAVVMQALALLIFQTLIVLCIRSLTVVTPSERLPDIARKITGMRSMINSVKPAAKAQRLKAAA